jgi:hypothetical protein
MRNDILASLAIALALLGVAALVGGAIVHACVRAIGGFRPGFRRCCLVVVLALLVALLFGYLLQLVPAVAALGKSGGLGAKALDFALRTTIVAGSIHLLVHRPDGGVVGYPRAFAIAAAAVAIGTALAWLVLLRVAMPAALAAAWH